MKAVILAGGEGTRLRPLSVNIPKPMVPLFEKPVLEHTLAHLKSGGITDITLTLQALPQVITDYFGDGSAHGVRLRHSIESSPLGTAGAVRACASGLKDDTVLVISGDGVCDFDFQAALKLHKERKADATIILYRSAEPLSYGLVMTDSRGLVTRFIEKPSWGQVFADTVNTGIYILERKALDLIPENKFYDFARDLFPDMLAKGEALYGYVAEGYWCDIGDTSAYLRCAFDVLDGKVSLSLGAEKLAHGVWSDSPVPAGTQLIPPCYIGRDVRLGQGVRVGPYAVLGGGTSLGEGAVVERSYLDGVTVGAHADINGAIVCEGASVGQGARLHEGCVIGEGVKVGAHAVVREGCRIWPGKDVPDGARTFGSISAQARQRSGLFDGGGRMTGQPNVDLTPDVALRVGAAAAAVAGGDVSISWRGGEAAHMTASALEAGVVSAGSGVVRHDAAFAACAAFAGGVYRFPLSVFVSQRGEHVSLFFYGADGMPLERAAELKIESAASRGEVTYREARAVGAVRVMSGISDFYRMTAAQPPEWFDPRREFEVAVRGGSAASRALSGVLESVGCSLRPEIRLPMLEVDDDGLTVAAIDERERVISHERLLCMLCLYEASQGNGELAIPYSAPMLLEHMGGRRRLTVRRLGRDPEARALMAGQPYMRDGVFMLARLAAALMTSGRSLAAMNDTVPPLYVSSVEIPVGHDRGAVMRALARDCEPRHSEMVEGIKTHVEDGWVHVTPLPGRRALRVTGEGGTEEAAAELCHSFKKLIEKADM